VTFANIKSRNFVEDKLSSTSFEKCLGVVCGCCDCCKPQEKVFKKKILSIDAAPNPDSILWENNDSKFLFFRRIISIAITILILAGCNTFFRTFQWELLVFIFWFLLWKQHTSWSSGSETKSRISRKNILLLIALYPFSIILLELLAWRMSLQKAISHHRA